MLFSSYREVKMNEVSSGGQKKAADDQIHLPPLSSLFIYINSPSFTINTAATSANHHGPHPSPAADFHFDSTTTSPYATAPSSPTIPFPKFSTFHDQNNHDFDFDFAFDFSGQLDPPSISDADQLFSDGKIKPLVALPADQPIQTLKHDPSRRRRRQTPSTTSSSSSASASSTTATKSNPSDNHALSNDYNKVVVVSTSSTNSQSSGFGFTWYNKWNLKDLLLFRSTSEGSATITKGDGDVKNWSFRSDGGGGRRRMKRKVSAHELHYTANRAVAEEMRRKTFLPYRSGLLGCLGFGHDVHEVSRRR